MSSQERTIYVVRKTERLGVEFNGLLCITRIDPIAKDYGFELGDQIVAVNDEKTTDLAHLADTLKGLSHFNVTVRRIQEQTTRRRSSLMDTFKSAFSFSKTKRKNSRGDDRDVQQSATVEDGTSSTQSNVYVDSDHTQDERETTRATRKGFQNRNRRYSSLD